MKVPFRLIDDLAELKSLDAQMRASPWIAFDTEFVSEYSYLPQLCLIQISTDSGIFLIDAIEIDDVSIVWAWLLEGDRPVIVHAGREEMLFCLRATGNSPAQWFDIQLAAGFVTTEYPSSYGKIVERFCNRVLPKGETRTDWRKRPLTKRQQEYACQDVIYLREIYERLIAELERRGRTEWYREEQTDWKNRTAATLATEAWHRLPGIHRLSRRQLGIAREVWRWREKEAAQRNVFPRRVLRDDLVIELARRESDQVDRIRAVRGMEWRKIGRSMDDIVAAVRRGMHLDEASLPKLPRGKPSTTIGNLLPQFLNTAVHSLCIAESISPALVATMQDVREFAEFHLAKPPRKGRDAPKLTVGWRGSLIGNTLNRLLDGDLAIRIEDPCSNHPLVIEEPSNHSNDH